MTHMTLIDDGYRAGGCNIGPAEVRARRISGHLGLAATLGLFGALVLFRADPIWRLALLVPAAVGAAGYLQAALRFCANYGWRGVFNLGEALRDTTDVTDAAAAAADRRLALRIALGSGAIGVAVAVGAMLLPI
jgi:hypothetical protein